MALGSTQPLTEMSTSAVVMKSGYLNFVEPSGPLQACNGTVLPFTFNRKTFGACGGVVIKVQRTNRQVAGSIPDGVIGIFQ